jgi:arginyl-tRNA synthetase
VIEEALAAWLRAGAAAAAPALGVEGDLPEPEILAPKQKEHGDFATNLALALAARAGRPPREVAQAIVDALIPAPFVRKVEVAGPGFINLFVTEDWLHDVLRQIVDQGESYGRRPEHALRAQVEFVSANPNGPLTIGHARNAAIGDTIARLLEAAGWRVERECYFNDTGGQMERFGASVEARYLQLLGRAAELPEDGYHGEYVTEYARDILEEVGAGLADLPPEERLVRLRDEGIASATASIRRTLDRFGVTMDSYFSESELARSGAIEDVVRRLRDAGYAYDADGAIWFRSTAFGDDKDRPLVRSNGRHTYFAADCAYLLEKFGRGLDHLVYVWGADHHGDVVRVQGAAQALGFDPGAVEIVIYQFVSFVRGGEPVKMSKRAGEFVTLDELIDEVGSDAARFTLLLLSSDHPMGFDIEAVKRRSMDNPVYYVQYGHARIASILRKAESAGVTRRPIADVDLDVLVQDAEMDLLRGLADVPAVIDRAVELRAPHRLAHAAQDVAGRFHRFYTECRVVSDDDDLTQARLWLCDATRRVLANLLRLLGVSAPERMERIDG